MDLDLEIEERPMQAITEATTVAVAHPVSEGVRARKRGWLVGWRGFAAIALLAVVAALAFSGATAAQQLLPLLFVLPCAAMMLMCSRHAGGHRQEAGKSSPAAGAPDISRQ